MNVEFTIETGDITEYSSDVVVLKHAQAFYGADALVRYKLEKKGISPLNFSPSLGEFSYLKTLGGLVAPNALFIGVPRLFDIDYSDIRNFASNTLKVLSDRAPETQCIATTIHGVGFGLDEVESFLAQLAGYLEILETNDRLRNLRRITIVDKNIKRVSHLRSILDQNFSNIKNATKMESGFGYTLSFDHFPTTDILTETNIPSLKNQALALAGSNTEKKPRLFVAMQFDKKFEDLFILGIQEVVRQENFVCERIDQSAFIGDILNKIKEKIESADVVIAELTGSNPNVYLEVGYAWGKGRPTILLANHEEQLLFDVRGQRCIKYESILDLKEKLRQELKMLKEIDII
jgi:hypothetical protein